MPFDEELRRTFDALADRLRDEVARQVDATEHKAADRLSAATIAAQAGAAAAREQGLAEGLAAGVEQGRASDCLLDGVRAIDGARSLSEILDALALAAGRQAARAAVFLVRLDQLRAWRTIGFTVARDDAEPFDVPLAEAGIIAEVLQSGHPASAAYGTDEAAMPAFARAAADAPTARCCDSVAMPIPVSGQVVAVLYGDDAAETPDMSRAGWQSRMEILARHAARSLEAVTAFRSAAVMTARADAAGVTPRDAQNDHPAVDEEDAHAARRYARLLISEIKLYHEDDLVAGTRERDLATRLGGEITRARVLYEQRVPAHVRQATDYFHAELVSTLANGDASLLEARR